MWQNVNSMSQITWVFLGVGMVFELRRWESTMRMLDLSCGMHVHREAHIHV